MEPDSHQPPPLEQPCPWLLYVVDPSYRETRDQIFCTIPSLPPHKFEKHSYPIPKQLQRETIRACSKGWLILSNKDCRHLSLYNPVTLESIHLPLLGKLWINELRFKFCLLTSPPDDPDSTLMIFRPGHPSILYCWLHGQKKIWKLINYSFSQLSWPVSCRGKIYAVYDKRGITKQLVVVETFEPQSGSHLIRDLNCKLPIPPRWHISCYAGFTYLVESCGDLFFIYGEPRNGFVVYKLDFSRMVWDKVERFRDRVFFLCVDETYKTFSCSCSAENIQGGSYIHYLASTRESINLYSYQTHTSLYSYNIEDGTTTFSCPCPNLSKEHKPIWLMFENRYHKNESCVAGDGDGKKEATVILSVKGDEDGDGNSNNSDDVGEKKVESMERLHLLDLSPQILELIIEQCTVVDYLNFRAVCKSSLLASSFIQWRKLQPKTSSTPWLMSLDKGKGIMTFIDPKLGDRCFLKVPELIGDSIVLSSNFGWLLISKDQRSLNFFNPFTKATVELPELQTTLGYFSRITSVNFSSPPNSGSCKVIAIKEGRAYITSPGKSQWVMINVGFEYCNGIASSVFYREDLHCLGSYQELEVLRMDLHYWELVEVKPPHESSYPINKSFLVECDNNLLLVSVSCNGQSVNVLKLNHSTMEWDKVESLGKHMIYVSDQSSFSTVAKIQGMENKIYFPRLYNQDVVFYSLDTCKFHIFGAKGNGKETEAMMNFYGTKVHVDSCWIEPNWSS